MPDIANLTDEQREALKELRFRLDSYRQAVEQRKDAELQEQRERFDLDTLAYKIAGAK